MAAFLASGVWGVMFWKQTRTGLIHTALDDHFAWGLYVQGFFFFSALAGGIMVFMAIATLFEVTSIRPLVEIGAAVSFGCLAAASVLLCSDLGKPFRGLKIATSSNFASPLTWDFFTLCVCGLLNLSYLLGLIPERGALSLVWSLLCLFGALTYLMIHTLFFLSRVGAGFRSQPFLGLDTLAQGLWGGMALMNLITLASGGSVPGAVKILLVLTALALIPLVGAYVASLSIESVALESKKIIAVDSMIFVALAAIVMFAPENTLLVGLMSALILAAVFLEKSHVMRQYQIKPTLPLPYSRYEDVPEYLATTSEWVLAIGSVGICLLLSTLIINLKGLLRG